MLYLEGAAHTLAPDIDLLEEQTIIYEALFSKYPDLAMQIMTAVQRGQAMDAAVQARG
jgi:hypothetical protein